MPALISIFYEAYGRKRDALSQARVRPGVWIAAGIDIRIVF